MKNKPVIAIDFGSTKVACVVAQLQPERRSYHILGAGLSRYPLSRAWPCDPLLMGQAVERALQETGVNEVFDRALVTLTHPDLSHQQVVAQIDVASEPVAIRNRELARLRAQAVAQALSIDREVLHLESLGYHGNGFDAVRNPHGLLTTRLCGTFQLVALPVAVRQVVRHALEVAGLDAPQLTYSMQPVAAACLDATMAASKRVLLVDIGGCVTDCSIIDRGVLLRTSTMPWGGMTVVDAIAKGCRLTMDQALAASLEGLASPRPGVREPIEQQLDSLGGHLERFIQGDVLPDAAIATGGGALIDGLVEWVERTSGIRATLGRSPRAQHVGDLPRQMALTAAFGLLEQAAGSPSTVLPKSSHPLNRLIEGTKAILIEYF